MLSACAASNVCGSRLPLVRNVRDGPCGSAIVIALGVCVIWSVGGGYRTPDVTWTFTGLWSGATRSWRRMHPSFTPAAHIAAGIASLLSEAGSRMNGQRVSLHG